MAPPRPPVVACTPVPHRSEMEHAVRVRASIEPRFPAGRLVASVLGDEKGNRHRYRQHRRRDHNVPHTPASFDDTIECDAKHGSTSASDQQKTQQQTRRGRTVQELDRGVDGRSCITLLTESRRATSHRAAGGTGRDHGVAVPSTAAGSGAWRAPGDSVRGGRARRTRGRRDAASPRRSGPGARGRSP